MHLCHRGVTMSLFLTTSWSGRQEEYTNNGSRDPTLLSGFSHHRRIDIERL